MTIVLVILGFCTLALFIAGAWLWAERATLRARLVASEEAARERVEALESKHRVELEAAKREGDEFRAQLNAWLQKQQDAFRQAIEASAGKAMNESSRQLLSLAVESFAKQQLEARSALDARVQPIAETLKKTEAKLGEIEKDRLSAYSSLVEQLAGMARTSEQLRAETGNLVASLRRPQVRGRYGEVQLRRVAELAGMRDYCDFTEQGSSRDDEGALKRPDMVVRLPNGRCVVVDAKTNIEAYIDAIEAPDEAVRERQLERFARHVADQAVALSKKEYWSQFDGAADLVVMFVPGDQFIDAALQRRPDLLELAAENRVILASPSTLIGLLRAIFVGWREKGLSDRAHELFDLGKDLHGRMAKVLDDFVRVGKKLEDASGAYNEAVASVDSRLMPTLRRFEEAGARSGKAMPEPAAIDVAVRAFKSLPAPGEPND
ncbi:MAG: DNA recombination protein RmuC [Phycisphaerae bacterium]|nr:DNA recombination protein RmuC [Phycisphaerae bacterium]